MKAAVLHCNIIDGDVVVQFATEEKPAALSTLEWLQNLVGGWIELIRVNPQVDAYINEEGKLQGLPKNFLATEMLQDILRRGDYIAGTIVFASHDEEGNTTTLDPVWLQTVETIYNQHAGRTPQ